MAGQVEFLEIMKSLEKIGEANGNKISIEEIKQYFSDMELSDAQLDSICRYLLTKRIVVENWTIGEPEDSFDEEITTSEDPLDKDMVNIYLKEAEKSSTLTQEQEMAIARKLIAGDENARNLLIEANLSFAVEIAKQYKGKGMQMSDLIQESNIGLMLAVNDFEPEIHGTFHSFAEQKMRQHVEAVLDEYNGSTRSAMKMASRINELNDIATAFAKEYEREAKPEEIAERMGISEEEVRELMKVSLDAIAVLDQGKIG